MVLRLFPNLEELMFGIGMVNRSLPLRSTEAAEMLVNYINSGKMKKLKKLVVDMQGVYLHSQVSHLRAYNNEIPEATEMLARPGV